MYGAIIGDIVGSRYERDGCGKTKEFPLFDDACRFTDDTVMTVAVADALLDAERMEVLDFEDRVKDLLVNRMVFWGKKYLNAGYGQSFLIWLTTDKHKPNGSFGNGSAMRVSPVGWIAKSPSEVLTLAKWSAEVSHNHPEGVAGAQATAMAIFMARTNADKDVIRDGLEKMFGYDLSRSLDDIREFYSFDVSCEGSVPEAIIAFLESDSYEDAIRNAVSLDGDTDTQAAIAGSIAEAYYGRPDRAIVERANEYLTSDILEVVNRFYGQC